jgi:hypothetical protein
MLIEWVVDQEKNMDGMSPLNQTHIKSNSNFRSTKHD